MKLPNWIAFFLYLVLIGTVAIPGAWALLPEKKTVDEEETTSAIVNEGIVAALGDENIQPSSESQVKEAVETTIKISAATLDIDDPDVEPIVQEELSEKATDSVTQAVTEIVEVGTKNVADAASELAPTASTEEIKAAAAVVVELSIQNLDIAADDLDDKESLSGTVDSAVAESFDDQPARDALEALDLSTVEENSLQSETANALTAGILESSDAATTATVQALQPLVIEELQTEDTDRLTGILDPILAILGALGVGSLVTAGVTTIARQGLLPSPFKLETESGRSLRYAVASHSTIEEARLERLVAPFVNKVCKVAIERHPYPFAIEPGHGEITFSFSPKSRVAASWNFRLLWWVFTKEALGKLFCAFRVNGHWYTYPIEVSMPKHPPIPKGLPPSVDVLRYPPIVWPPSEPPSVDDPG